METHVTHACNLRCMGCTHYCDYGVQRDWYVTPEQFEHDVRTWSARIDPMAFLLLGGEPTLHPQICQLLLIATKYFKAGIPNEITGNCPVAMTTNGSFLHKHPDLKQILSDNNIGLIMSGHYNETEERISMLREWKREGMQINIWDYPNNPNLHWRKLYKGYGPTMEPYDDPPEISWQKCQCRRFFQVHQGKLWKCAPIAYFQFVDEKFGLSKISDKWSKFVNYKPLEPNCSFAELKNFLERKAESVCGYCPAEDVYGVNIKAPPLKNGQAIESLLPVLASIP